MMKMLQTYTAIIYHGVHKRYFYAYHKELAIKMFNLFCDYICIRGVYVVVLKIAELHEKDNGRWQKGRGKLSSIWQQSSQAYKVHLAEEGPGHEYSIQKQYSERVLLPETCI